MIPKAVLFLAVVLGAPALWSQAFPAEAVQAFRGGQGLSIPTWDPALAQTCADRAQALAVSGVLSHVDDLARGPGSQLVALGFPPGEYGEILGAGADSGAVWAAWLASAPHREVLETPGWVLWAASGTSVGKTKVWVVRFWKP